MTFTCDKCGASFTRKLNFRRHQTSRCKSMVAMKTSANNGTSAVKENDHQQLDDHQRSSVIDSIINKKRESGDATIQPLKSTSMVYAVQNIVDTSPFEKEPVEEIFFGCETAKNLDISSAKSKESNEDETVSELSLAKKRKLMSENDASLIKAEEQNESNDDNPNHGKENMGNKEEDKDENEDVSDYDLNDNDDDVFERGEEESANEDDSEDNDNDSISKEELKDRLYRSGNNM